MFGKNETAPKRDTEKTFLVKSIFYTIQGEGPYSGHPAVFVRLGGCNLKCYFCDTDFTTDLEEMTPEELCKAIAIERIDCPLVVLTGGEPMLQNLALLISAIAIYLPNVEIVQIETAGTVWPTGLQDVMHQDDPKTVIVCSPKTPKVHPQIAYFASAWKYIISAKGTHLRGIPIETFRPPHNKTVYLQPMDEQDVLQNGRNEDLCRDLCMRHGYWLSLQVHKLVGVE